jgi:hypothetical protein
MDYTYNRLVQLLEICIEDPKLLLQNNVSLSDEPTLPLKPENELLFTCSIKTKLYRSLKRQKCNFECNLKKVLKIPDTV